MRTFSKLIESDFSTFYVIKTTHDLQLSLIFKLRYDWTFCSYLFHHHLNIIDGNAFYKLVVAPGSVRIRLNFFFNSRFNFI